MDGRDVYVLRFLRGVFLELVLIAAGMMLFCGIGEAAGPAAAEPLEAAKLLGALPAAGRTSQFILVDGHELTFWEKGSDGRFALKSSSYCGYGKEGLKPGEERIEGDLTTPVGIFPITGAFGLAEDPGTALPYRRITPDSYWSGEPEDYNTWVETNSRSMPNSEHLIEWPDAYEYAMVIGFNMDPVVLGHGAGIFLHCKRLPHWYTAGCVSIPQPALKQLLCQCRPGVRIVIVRNLEEIAKLSA